MKSILNPPISLPLGSKVQLWGLISLVFASILTFGFILNGQNLPMALPDYSVDSNGNLTMAYPLDIPEGTGGMTPQISLNYHSQSGSASMGKGWMLSGLPEIRRDAHLNSYKEQKYSHNYNGSLLLMNGTGKYGFMAESFARLEMQGNPTNPDSWIERSPDGNWKLYGDGIDHTITSLDGIENWVWVIKSEQDVYGNEITYEYYKNDGNLLPKEIIYANGKRSIEFSYVDFDDDKISYVLRNQRKETKILSDITFYSDGSRTHSYELEYDINNNRKVFSLKSILYKADSFLNTHTPIIFQKTGKPRGLMDQLAIQNIQTNGYGTLVDTVDRLFELLKQILFQKMMSQVQAGAKRGTMNSFERSTTANFNGTISTLSGTSASNLTGRFPKQIQSGMKRSIAPSTSLGEIYLNIAQDAVSPPNRNDSEFQNMSTEGVGRFPLKDRKSCDWGVIACICHAVVPGCHTEVINYCGQFLFFGGLDACQNGINSPVAMAIPTDINGDGISEYSRLLGRMDSTMSLHIHDELGSFGDTVLANLPIRYNTFMDVADIDGDGRTDFAYASGGKLHVAFSEGTYLSNPVAFNHVAVKDMPLNFSRVDEYKPSDFFMDWNRDGRTDFIHVEGQLVNVYLSTGRNFAGTKTYNLNGLEPIEIITKDESPTSAHRLSGFADMDGDGLLEHVMVRPSPIAGLNSAIPQIEAQNKLELEQKKAEFTPERNQLVGILASPSGYSSGQIAETRGQLKEVDRENFDQLIAGEIALNSTLEETFITSFETYFVGPKIENIVQEQRLRLQAEQNRLAELNIQFSSFVVVVTYFSPNGVAVRQESNSINTLGLNGMNWLLDVNGDGLPDLVSLTNELSKQNPYSVDSIINELLKVKNVELVVRLNEGGRFSASTVISTIGASFSNNSGGYQLADVNLDGEVDFLVPTGANGKDYVVFLGNGLGNFTSSGKQIGLPIDEEVKSLKMEDRNGDGIPDMHIQYGRNFKTKLVTSARDYPEGMVTQITDGSGGSATVNYTWKKDEPGAVVEANRSYENGIPNYSSQVLVKSISQQASPNLAVSTKSYTYANQRFKVGTQETSANIGFETITESYSMNGIPEAVVTTRYTQNPALAGSVIWQEVRDNQNVLVARTEMSYTLYYPTPVSKLILPTSSTSLSYVNGNLIDTKTTTTTYNPSYAYSPATITQNWNGRITSHETYYGNDLGLGILALPIEEITTIDGELVAHTKTTFAGSDITSTSKLVAPGKWYSQNFTYDSLGNVITQSDNLGRSLSYSYGGTTGSLPTEATNALAQKTITEYDPKTDAVIRTTDANLQVLENSYDSVGRKTQTSLNGTPIESYTYEFTGSQYITTKTLHTYEGDTWTKQIADKEGKTLKSQALVTTGITQTEETSYDTKGRAIQKSHSYLTGETPTYTITEYYSQAEDSNQRPKRVTANTGEVTNLTYTPTTTTVTTEKEGEILRTETLTTDNFGQLISKTVQGESIQYQYNKQGRLTRVTDPAGSITSMSYDIGGRKTSQTDNNSGTLTYTYNNAGEMLTQTDAKGLTQTFTTDNLGRITKISPSNSEPPIQYIYDQSNSLSSNNTVGKLTKVSDSTGYTEYAYDNRGNNIAERKVIDDLTVQFHRSYDALGRMKKLTYPEGTEIEYMYTNTGQITSILMHAHDGSYRNQPVVQYIGPIQEDGKLYVRRKTGNNVVMDIEYDPLRRRPKSLKTTLAEGQVEQSISYNYDKKGNITEITDRLNESRNQAFTYDALNRVTKAIGKYGTEDYSYHKNGNLLQRGQFALQYSNSNHVHAVTKVTSLQTGDTNYSYDTTGNLTERNGDVYRYNSQNKLTEITTAGGDVFQYSYDASGNRIKKALKNANTTTYAFNNLYEIHRSPGEPEKHTLYIPGIEGDMVAQYTRSDAMLVQTNIDEDRYASVFVDSPEQNTFLDQRRNFLEAKTFIVSLYREIETDIALVLFNIPKPKLLTDNYQMLPSMRVIIWVLAFGILVYYALTLKSQEAQSSRRLRLATTLALFPFYFALSAGCSPLFFGGAESKEGIPPWLLGALVPGDTPSVSDDPTFFGGNGGQTTTNSARITGMYFFHPDHLGSITMITDGRGNVLAGGERGGKSHISYRPYGEILRTDSYGPDISKFKYTGQEEDKESGLYFYKARYYDAKIGRFLQADSMAFPNQINGMNRMMYVEGNPVGFRDPSGNATNYGHMFSQIVKHMTGGIKWASGGIAGAANAVNKAMNKPTNYDRTPFAKSIKGIFGNSLGGTINKYWNNVFNKTWTKWNANDFGIAFKAWGGSFIAMGAAVGVAGMANAAGISGTNTLMYNSNTIGYTMIPSLTGYITGGLHKANFYSLNWDQAEAESRASEYASIQLRFTIGFAIGPLLGVPGAGMIGFLAGLGADAAYGSRGSILVDDIWNGPVRDTGLGGHHRKNEVDYFPGNSYDVKMRNYWITLIILGISSR
jgi:RHS repeat-associated protein